MTGNVQINAILCRVHETTIAAEMQQLFNILSVCL